MLIINADDWGGTLADTDAAFSCYKKGRITSVSAMVFMEGSARAANLAKESGIDAGLHLNFDQAFTGPGYEKYSFLKKYHDQTISFLTLSKYAFLFYNPLLRKQFKYVFNAQYNEFLRLYEKPPSHINGHHHMHLCSNMLFDRIIPKYHKIRRNFTFKQGQKGLANRIYRALVDRWLKNRYFVTNYFFALSSLLNENNMSAVIESAKNSNIEIMTHPAVEKEYNCLMSNEYLSLIRTAETGTYRDI